MEPIRQGTQGSAVEDVQRRLRLLGYITGASDIDGVFGDLTAAAVRSFRLDEGLSEGSSVDARVWAALVNATFPLGDRTLYLRMPFFHGRDVTELQTTLRTLGFPCGEIDGIFGAHTERATREFQSNVGLESDGIVGDSTFDAIERLHHAWRDKDILAENRGNIGYARAAEVLEHTDICVFGIDTPSRSIASRISNLALATNAASKVVSAEDSISVPDTTTLLVRIMFPSSEHPDGLPLIVYEQTSVFPRRLKAAIDTVAPGMRRIAIEMPDTYLHEGEVSDRDAQHLAIGVLDALCAVFV